MTLGAPFVINFLAERKMLEKNEILLTRILFGSHFLINYLIGIFRLDASHFRS